MAGNSYPDSSIPSPFLFSNLAGWLAGWLARPIEHQQQQQQQQQMSANEKKKKRKKEREKIWKKQEESDSHTTEGAVITKNTIHLINFRISE